MPQVKFTAALKRFFPDLQPMKVAGATVADILTTLEGKFPGLRDYIVDEQGELRQHVNIFIGESLIEDRNRLSDTVGESDEIFFFQALSGG
ncbi:MAG: MoaD/ThiS family protein [Bacteroidota bacterium]